MSTAELKEIIDQRTLEERTQVDDCLLARRNVFCSGAAADRTGIVGLGATARGTVGRKSRSRGGGGAISLGLTRAE